MAERGSWVRAQHTDKLSEDQPWDHLLQLSMNEQSLSHFLSQSIRFKPEVMPFITFLKVKKTTAWVQAALAQFAAKRFPYSGGIYRRRCCSTPLQQDAGYRMATAARHLGRNKRGAQERAIISTVTCGAADLWWAGISSVKWGLLQNCFLWSGGSMCASAEWWHSQDRDIWETENSGFNPLSRSFY